jgi:hypothetical protein
MKKFLSLFLALTYGCMPAFAQPYRIGSDDVVIGAGANATNKLLEFNAGLGSANPKLRANLTTGQLEFTNDGTNYAGIGSGSGGGSGVSLLQNAGFEAALTQWTNSGTTAAAVTSGSNLLFDKGSATLIATSTGQFFEQSVVVPNGLGGTNCLARAYYKGGDTNWVMHVTDNSNMDIASSNPFVLIPSTVTVPAVMNFICPAAGTTIKLRFVSLGSAALIALDNTKLGDADNLSQVSQAQFLGSITYSGSCSVGYFTGSNVGSWGNFGAQTGCTVTTDGAVSAPGTQIPAVVLPNGVAPGVYTFVTTGMFGSSSGYVQLRYYDGTNVSSETSTASSVPSPLNFQGHITYATGVSGPLTIYLQEYAPTSVSGYLYAGTGTYTSTETIKVYYNPTQSQQAVQSQCASTGSCVNHLSATVTATCTSSPCTIASQNVPWLSSITRTSAGSFTPNFVTGFFSVAPVCSAVANASGASVALANLSSSVTTSSFSFVTYNGSLSLTDFPFTITCDKQGADISSMSAPILVGSVTADNAGANRTIYGTYFANGGSYGTICTTSTCSSTSTLAGVTVTQPNTSSAEYAINFPSGTFSAIPSCFLSVTNPTDIISGGPDTDFGTYPPTTTAFHFQTGFGGTSFGSYGNFMCIGLR